MRRNFAVSFAILTLCIITTTSCGDGTTLIEHTLNEDRNISETKNLQIESKNGRLIVTGVDVDRLTVKAMIKAESQERADACKIKVEESEDSLKIFVEWPDEQRDKERCNLEVSYPIGSKKIGIDHKNGRVQIIDLEGRLEVNSSNSKVQIRNHDDDVVIRSDNGDVSGYEITGDVDITNENGFIKLVGIQKSVKLKHSNGRCEVKPYPTSQGTINIDADNVNMQIVLGSQQVGTFDLAAENGECFWYLGKRGVLKESNGEISGTIEVKASSPKSTIRTTNGKIRFFVDKMDP